MTDAVLRAESGVVCEEIKLFLQAVLPAFDQDSPALPISPLGFIYSFAFAISRSGVGCRGRGGGEVAAVEWVWRPLGYPSRS